VTTYRRGRYWSYSFTFKGQRVQKSTHVTSRRIALKMESIHKAQLAQGVYGLGLTPQKVPTFSDFGVQYLTYSKANKQSYGVERYYIAGTLSSFFGRTRLDEITPLTVERYKLLRLKDGLKKSSINREVGLLKSMLSSAVEWKLVERNGATEAKLFRLDEPTDTRVLTYDEESRLLAACDNAELRLRAPHLKTIILIALYTGLRRGEILRLRWSDIDFQNKNLIVRKSKTAAGQGRRVNLNVKLLHQLSLVDKKLESEWLFPSPQRFQTTGDPAKRLGDVKHGFRKAVKLSGIPKITFHQLRHTFCSRLADAGVPLPVIQDLAGHSSIMMTRRYTHPGNDLKQKAVESLIAPST
jgi:integrase